MTYNIIKLVLGCFAVLTETDNGFTYTEVTSRSLKNNALKTKRCTIFANFCNIKRN